MNQHDTMIPLLNDLITTYCFNINTLSKCLDVPANQLEALSRGNSDFLSDDPDFRSTLFSKILFLHACAAENKDTKLRAFLKVLISYHGLSPKTIAKMAGVEADALESLLSCPPTPVSEDVKYKIAVTVMALRFFLKDYEPTL